MDETALDTAVAGRAIVHRVATGRSLQPFDRVSVGPSDERAHRAHTSTPLVGAGPIGY